MNRIQRVSENLERLRNEAPLVHNITNFVVMNFTANLLLAAGASPVMAHAIEEVEEMSNISRSLVVNIGTLSAPWIESMKKAILAAHSRSKPVIFDPVGVGATDFRTRSAKDLMRLGGISIVRGNASEVLALNGENAETKGVESRDSSHAAVNAAKSISEKTGAIVCVSGAVDFVIDRNRISKIYNGHPLMSKVTGMGCGATALIGAFAAIEPDLFLATESAMLVMGIAGELAAERAQAPGSFKSAFLIFFTKFPEPKSKTSHVWNLLRTFDLSLYLVTDPLFMKWRSVEVVVEEAIREGVSFFQLREKECSDSDFISLGKKLLDILKPHRIPFIVNDRVDLALKIGADGVHLGQSDLPPEEARKILGEKAIIGFSVSNLTELHRSKDLDVDYLGVGSVFPTRTKKDIEAVLGIEGLKKIRGLTDRPIVAIGGIDSSNAEEVKRTGVNGIAVVSAVCSAFSPATEAKKLKTLIREPEVKFYGENLLSNSEYSRLR